MARRRRSRKFNRVSPDMGWMVAVDDLVFINGAGSQGTAETVFSFDDITDSDTITRDKSDWFVKRVLVEAYPAYGPQPDNNQSDSARIWTFALGTIDNNTIAEWLVNSSFRLCTPAGYEMWARLFRMYNKPVYRSWTPRLDGATGAQEVDTAIGATGAFYANSTPWGLSAVHDDFTVSNAGVKPQQTMVIAASTASGPGQYEWNAGDELNVQVFTRVLLQKRREA